MNRYKVRFLVNGMQTEQIVSAIGDYQARKMIEAQYSGAKIIFQAVIRLF